MRLRNSFCTGINGPCRYGSLNMQLSLAVSSDVYYYRLGETFFTTPGPTTNCCRTSCATSAFGAETGIDLPYEFDGRLPDDETKAALVESGALSRQRETTASSSATSSTWRSGKVCSPRRRSRWRSGYRAFANGGYVLQPACRRGDLRAEHARRTRRDPGFVDLARAVVHERFVPVGRQIPMDFAEPIIDGIRQNVTGPGSSTNSTTAEELFDVNWSEPAAPPVAGKTGTAQGRFSYPWNDSSVFGAFSQDSAGRGRWSPYLEKSGFGSLGAAPVVKCMYQALAGVTPLDPVAISEPLDPTNEMVAQPLPPIYDLSCMRSTNPHTIYPGRRHRAAPPTDLPTLLVRRKPDSGLGNIRSSPAAPSRNVDWTLMLAQAALTVIGCFIVYSASRDPPRRSLLLHDPPGGVRVSPPRSCSPS